MIRLGLRAIEPAEDRAICRRRRTSGSTWRLASEEITIACRIDFDGLSMCLYRFRSGRLREQPCARRIAGQSAGNMAASARWRGRSRSAFRERPIAVTDVGRSTAMNLALTPAQQEIREAVLKICARFGDDYWLERDTRRRIPARVPPGAGQGRLARHRHARGVRRRRPRHHRSGADDAGDRRVGRRPVRRLGRAHEHLRSQSGGRVRHRGAEAALPAAADRRQGEGLLRRDRAQRRPRHHAASRRGPCATATATSSHGQKIWISTAQVADQHAAARPHHAARGGARSATEGLSLFYTDLDRNHVEVREIDKMGRKAVDSNQLFIDGLRGAARGPHRRGRQGLRLHPARHESRAHPDRGRGGRPRPRGARSAPRATPRSASSSTGRSARTRPSSIRWPGAGWSSRPPT